ncbi:hypothetical protein [Pseudescherichia sp.]|uniref:hypothetical protein n=1 Tax=Pseudescherichia sp. TaxID=2055881 RepID=UPI00289B3F43|nr:hypothetical protein [Pseudescherichia sp.]WPO93985.1 hypothetical protein SFA32_13550 [Buttiauxella sp. HR94]
MRLLPWVAGSIFYDLLQHGREIESAIARHDASLLNHTTPALERYFSHPPSELPRQNPYTVATLFPLFLVAFALNLLPFLHALPGLSPPLHALSFFAPSLVMIVALIRTCVLLAKGFTAGMTGFLSLYLILLGLAVLQGLHHLLTGSGSGWTLVAVILALYACRNVFNSRGFVLFTIYCRTQRLVALTRKMRLSSR